MASASLEYTHPADDLAQLVTPTVEEGTAAEQYGPERLSNNDPSYPFKTDTTTVRLVWDFGVPVSPELIALIHPNLDAGLEAVWEANDANVWTAPAFSRAFPAAAYHEDDFPKNLHLDLRDELVLPSYRYLSLLIDVDNSVPLSIGEIVIAQTVRSLDGRFESDTEEDEAHPVVIHTTDVGVDTIFAHGTRWRWTRGTKVEGATNAAKIRSWRRAARDQALPFLLLAHLADDEVQFCRFDAERGPRKYLSGPSDWASQYTLAFKELGRGLKPTPMGLTEAIGT